MKSYLNYAVLVFSLVSLTSCHELGKPSNKAEAKGKHQGELPKRQVPAKTGEGRPQASLGERKPLAAIPICQPSYVKDFLTWKEKSGELNKDALDQATVKELSELCDRLFSDRTSKGCDAVDSFIDGEMNKKRINPAKYFETCDHVKSLVQVSEPELTQSTSPSEDSGSQDSPKQ